METTSYKRRLEKIIERRHLRRDSFFPYFFIIGGAVIIAAILLLAVYGSYQSRGIARKAVDTDLANLTSTLAIEINNSVHQIDLGMLAVRDEVSRQQKKDRWDDSSIVAVIAQEDSRHPEAIGFRVFGPDGKLRYAVSNVVNRDVDFSQRDDFKTLRDNPADTLLVMPPFVGPVAQEWLIALGRRITNPDGTFGGAVYSAIPVQRLIQMFAALDLGPGGAVAVYHTSFQLAARFPEAKVGTSTISDQLRAIIMSGVPSARFDNLSPVDGVRRTGNARKIDGLPYYISVAFADDDWLTEWRDDRNQLILLSALLIGIVLFGATILYRNIGARQKALEALATSEAQFRKLMEQSPLAMGLLGSNGEVSFLNRKFTETFGYQSEDIPNLARWLDLAYPDETYRAEVIAMWTNTVEKARAQKSEIEAREFEVTCKNGNVKIVSIFGVLVSDQVLAIFNDITEHKLLEQQLKRESLYRHKIINAVPGVLYVFDANGRFLIWNQNLEIVLGRSSEEIAKAHPLDFFEGQDKLAVETAIRQTFSDGTSVVEGRLVTKNGMSIPYLFNGFRFELDDGPGLVGIGIDISERIEAESRVENKRILLRTLLTTIPDLVWMKDQDGVYLICNTEFERFFGAKEAEIVGKTDYDFVDKELASFFRQKDKEAMEAGKPNVHEVTVTYASDGHQALLETVKTVIFDVAGNCVGVLGVARDITERKRFEEELKEMAQTDPLTGLANRRAFIEAMDAEFHRRRRFGSAASLLMIDIDHFKKINDTHGHEAGDRALVLLAETLKSMARATDMPSRFGGEEFVFLLVGAEISGAVETAERIREAVSQIVATSLLGDFGFTVSIGVSSFMDIDKSWSDTLQRADNAMYQAKEFGRNRIVANG